MLKNIKFIQCITGDLDNLYMYEIDDTIFGKCKFSVKLFKDADKIRPYGVLKILIVILFYKQYNVAIIRILIQLLKIDGIGRHADLGSISKWLTLYYPNLNFENKYYPCLIRKLSK